MRQKNRGITHSIYSSSQWRHWSGFYKLFFPLRSTRLGMPENSEIGALLLLQRQRTVRAWRFWGDIQLDRTAQTVSDYQWLLHIHFAFLESHRGVPDTSWANTLPPARPSFSHSWFIYEHSRVRGSYSINYIWFRFQAPRAYRFYKMCILWCQSE